MKYNKSKIMKNAWAIRRAEKINMSSALKKAWALAKKEENHVDDKIKAIIDKYHLVRKGDKVGTYQTRGINVAEFNREVGENKAAILAYFDAQEKAASDLRERREKTFNSIPGVAELRKAHAQRAQWQREFNRMMEEGDGVMHHVEAPTPQELAEMESRYPMAVFALEAEYRAIYSSNYELQKIWQDTYDAIRDGQAIEQVKASHDAKMDQFSAAHAWD